MIWGYDHHQNSHCCQPYDWEQSQLSKFPSYLLWFWHCQWSKRNNINFLYIPNGHKQFELIMFTQFTNITSFVNSTMSYWLLGIFPKYDKFKHCILRLPPFEVCVLFSEIIMGISYFFIQWRSVVLSKFDNCILFLTVSISSTTSKWTNKNVEKSGEHTQRISASGSCCDQWQSRWWYNKTNTF